MRYCVIDISILKYLVLLINNCTMHCVLYMCKVSHRKLSWDAGLLSKLPYNGETIIEYNTNG